MPRFSDPAANSSPGDVAADQVAGNDGPQPNCGSPQGTTPTCAPLEQQERVLYRQVRAVTDAMFGEPLNQHPDYARVRETLNTSMRGVALTYAFDRRHALRDPHIADWVALATGALPGAR